MTIYIVKNLQSNDRQMVEADNRTQAFRHIGEALLSVSVATTKDVEELMTEGKKVLRKIEPQTQLPLEPAGSTTGAA